MRVMWGLAFCLALGACACAQAPLQGVLEGLTLRQDYEAARASSSSEDLSSNGDALPIPPNETLTLLDVDGPGAVTHFWNTIAPYDPFAGRSVVLRVYYDGNEHPSVQAPLGDFFAVGHGANKNVKSLPVTVSSNGLSRTCYWRMPFRKHIKITVTNESPVFSVVSFYYYLDWQKHASLPDKTMYFHAKYRQEMPAQPGHYTILETEGQGHYAGTVYSVEQVELGWFGEGDDFIYVDGAEYPQFRGTGTEDYFNDAWGFREFCAPFHGVSLYEGIYPSDRVTAYRWHIQDPIPFDESLKVTIEHRGSVMNEAAETADDVRLGGSTERPDWVSSVAFWYQYPPVGITEALPPADKRVAPYEIVPVGPLPCRADPPEEVTPGYVGKRYFTTGDKASIEFDFEIEEAGRYRIRGLFEDTIAGGIFQAFLDGETIGLPMDMVVPDSALKWHDLDLHDLKAGTHTLRFEKVIRKSPTERSIDFKFTNFTLEYLLLLRLEDMEGYHQLYDERVNKQ